MLIYDKIQLIVYITFNNKGGFQNDSKKKDNIITLVVLMALGMLLPMIVFAGNGKILEFYYNADDSSNLELTNYKGRAPDMVKGYYGVQWHSRDAKNGSYDKYYGQKNPRLSNEFNLENTIVTKGNYNPWDGYIRVEDDSKTMPTSSKVLVDNKAVSFEAYTIDNNNYIKLRDLAYAVTGTDRQFEVSWDAEKGQWQGQIPSAK